MPSQGSSERPRAGPPSGDPARFAGAEQVGGAAAADRRMRRVVADVVAVVPAALALRRARPRLDREVGGVRASASGCSAPPTRSGRSAGRRRAPRSSRAASAAWLDDRPRPAATSRAGRSARSASICGSTSARTSRDALAHLASSAGVGPGAQRRCRSRRRSRAIAFGPNTFHASSAVKLRNGAIQRSIAWAMCQSAVCAERRAVRLRRRRVEAVLQDVEVERAEVLGAEHLQLGDHRVELVDAVVAARRTRRGAASYVPTISACSCRRARERPAVDLEHLARAAPRRRRVEVARVGEQEAQRVADAPVRVDDAGEDLVVDREVARVVGRCAPEADDLGAELLGRFAQADEVAEALAHLAARAVDGEAVRQQAAVGRVAFDRAGDQERRVEPAAVLVVAFEVEVGLGALAVVVGVRRPRMAAAQDVEERRSGVEPDVEDVVALGVVLGRTLAVRRGRLRRTGATTPRRRPARRSPPRDRSARACRDAARRSPCAGRAAAARPSCVAG